MSSKRIARFSASDLPQEILSGIGAIVAQWGYLAFQLTVIIREGFGLTKEAGRALTIGAEIGVLCGTLKTLASCDHWIKDKEIRDEIKNLADDVREKSTVRHDYAHGVFGYLIGQAGGPDEEKFVRYLMSSAKHRVKPDTEEITPESLKKHADSAFVLWTRAQDITTRLKALRRKRF